jgi:hypothetical protein
LERGKRKRCPRRSKTQKMKIEIKPLSVDVLDDFLFFFDNIEFHDHPEWAVC